MSSWGDQFSSGDQGPNRRTFAASSYRECPQCKGNDIKMDKHCAGCRHNGDGYGTEVYVCQTCHWETSFQYDEADGSPYYYETRNWTFSSLLPSFTRAEPEKPKFEGTPITDSERETYTKMKKLAPPEAVRSMMMVKGIRKKDIDKLLNA